jgi:hypothetical protein
MGLASAALPRSLSTNAWFVISCVLAYALIVLLVPSPWSLIEQDSAGYINFSPLRPALYPAFIYLCTALHLNLVQITWVQLSIFCASLAFLLSALLRSGFSKPLVALFVFALAANVLYSTIQNSILSDSLFFSLGAITLGLWIEYLRTGKVAAIAVASLLLGLMIGIRLAGLGLIPLHIIAVYVRWSKRDVSALVMIAALVGPLMCGAGIEYLIYRVAHPGQQHQSRAHYVLFGKGAMLIRSDTVYSGPHAAALNAIGAKVYSIYEPIQRLLADAPLLQVRVLLSAQFEAMAKDYFLVDDIERAAAKEKTSAADLRFDFGKQTIEQNVIGFLELTLINDLGQWSVAVRRFPPTGGAIAQYLKDHPIAIENLDPTQPSIIGLIAYPVFLTAGGVSLLFGLGFFVFLLRPSLADTTNGFYVLLATYFGAMCHCYTLFVSLVTDWEPRYLMAVYPQLVIIALCIIRITSPPACGRPR